MKKIGIFMLLGMIPFVSMAEIKYEGKDFFDLVVLKRDFRDNLYIYLKNPTENILEIKEIYIDGRDIKDYKLFYLRSQIGMVLQEPFLFSGTIAENIAFGKIDATRKEIEEVAKVAHAHDFIKELPDGYDTDIGEMGEKISVGQKQRIAIARVLLKNPPILILDEATSSVDSETEKLIQEALERLMKGRTSIVIAHRLSTIKNATKILVLKDGEIVESGTHIELLEKGGLYYHLYKIQAGFGEIKEELSILMKKEKF